MPRASCWFLSWMVILSASLALGQEVVTSFIKPTRLIRRGAYGDFSPLRQPMTLHGKSYGCYVIQHPGSGGPTEAIFALHGEATRFTAVVGIDQSMNPNDPVGDQPDVEYQIYADGKLVWKSGIVTHKTPAIPVDVNLSGVQELRLVVTDGGDDCYHDWAVWADPVIHFSDHVADCELHDPYHIVKLAVEDASWQENQRRLKARLELAQQDCLAAIQRREEQVRAIGPLMEQAETLNRSYQQLQTELAQALAKASAPLPPQAMQSDRLKDLLRHYALLEAAQAELDGRLLGLNETEREKLYIARIDEKQLAHEIESAAREQNEVVSLLSGYLLPEDRARLEKRRSELDVKLQALKDEERYWTRWARDHWNEVLHDTDRSTALEDELMTLRNLIQEETDRNEAFRQFKHTWLSAAAALETRLKTARREYETAADELDRATARYESADRQYMAADQALAGADAEYHGFAGGGRPRIDRLVICPVDSHHAVYNAVFSPQKAAEIEQLASVIEQLRRKLEAVRIKRSTQRAHYDAAAQEVVRLGDELVSAIWKSTGVQLGTETAFYFMDLFEEASKGGLKGVVLELTKKAVADIALPLIQGKGVGFEVKLPDAMEGACDEPFSGLLLTPGESIALSTKEVLIGKVKTRVAVVAPRDAAAGMAGRLLEGGEWQARMAERSAEWQRFFHRINNCLEVDDRLTALRSSRWETLTKSLDARLSAVTDLGWDVAKDVVKDELKQQFANAIEGKALHRQLLAEIQLRCERADMLLLSQLYHEIRDNLDVLLEQRYALLQDYDPVTGFQVEYEEPLAEGRAYWIEVFFQGAGPNLGMEVTLGGQTARIEKRGQTSTGWTMATNPADGLTQVKTLSHVFSIQAQALDCDANRGVTVAVHLK
jgi:hypothetical protein